MQTSKWQWAPNETSAVLRQLTLQTSEVWHTITEEDPSICCRWGGQLVNGRQTKRSVEDRCLHTLVLCPGSQKSLLWLMLPIIEVLSSAPFLLFFIGSWNTTDLIPKHIKCCRRISDSLCLLSTGFLPAYVFSQLVSWRWLQNKVVHARKSCRSTRDVVLSTEAGSSIHLLNKNATFLSF